MSGVSLVPVLPVQVLPAWAGHCCYVVTLATGAMLQAWHAIWQAWHGFSLPTFFTEREGGR